jgi:hypothetical protein
MRHFLPPKIHSNGRYEPPADEDWSEENAEHRQLYDEHLRVRRSTLSKCRGWQRIWIRTTIPPTPVAQSDTAYSAPGRRNPLPGTQMTSIIMPRNLLVNISWGIRPVKATISRVRYLFRTQSEETATFRDYAQEKRWEQFESSSKTILENACETAWETTADQKPT